MANMDNLLELTHTGLGPDTWDILHELALSRRRHTTLDTLDTLDRWALAGHGGTHWPGRTD